MFTTWGSVRGCCGHAHRSIEAAVKCIKADRAACKRQGGYSDREVREYSKPHLLKYWHVSMGPGHGLRHDNDDARYADHLLED
jgi:hypothetical protein